MKRYSLKKYQFYLLFLTVAISLFGVVVIGSAEQSVQKTQIAGLLLSILVMIIVSLFDYNWVLRFYWAIYAVAIALLLAVRLLGDSSHGAKRWIDLGFMQFQPSELCKILLILFFARFFSVHKDRLSSFGTIVLSCALVGLPLALVLMQPDLSTTIIIMLVFCVMIFVAGLRRKIVVTVIAIFIPLVLLALFIATRPNQTLFKGYQQTRILAWLYPEEYTSEEGMQQQNSIIAIGSGQLSGKGLNNDNVDSLKNGNFVPEPQTDFIFAVIGEELGFVGCLSVILLLLLIVINCLVIAKQAKDLSGTLICCGMGGLIGFQSMVNLSVTTGLCPNTGVTLPFVSYGLTSLVSLFIGIGFVMNVGMQPQKYERQVRII